MQHVETDLASDSFELRLMRPSEELWSELGDGADQAARLAGVADSATPSVNLTPAMTLGN